MITSLVQPHLCYSSSVWDPYYQNDISTLEKVQRKGARFVTGIYSYTESVTSMLDYLHWPPLQHRRKLKRFITFYKAANNLSPVTSQIMSLPPPTAQEPTISATYSFILIMNSTKTASCLGRLENGTPYHQT